MRERLETSFAVDLLAVTPFKYKLVSLAVTRCFSLFGRGAHTMAEKTTSAFSAARRRRGGVYSLLFLRVAKFGVNVIMLN